MKHLFITEETGIDYFWKTSDPWDWFGKQCWWEVLIEFTGINGCGGAWVIEKWRWNSSTEIIKSCIRSLSPDETDKIIEAICSRKQPVN